MAWQRIYCKIIIKNVPGYGSSLIYLFISMLFLKPTEQMKVMDLPMQNFANWQRLSSLNLNPLLNQQKLKCDFSVLVPYFRQLKAAIIV